MISGGWRRWCGPAVVLLAVGVVVGLASPARADNPAVISGTVTARTNGAPLAGSVVTALAPEGPGSYLSVDSETTDANGGYALQVPAGTYRLTVVPPAGYEAVSLLDPVPVSVTVVSNEVRSGVSPALRTYLTESFATTRQRVAAGGTARLTFAVHAADGTVPRGSVRFFDHMTTLATAALGPGGASALLRRLASGTYEVQAQATIAGDSYAVAGSAAVGYRAVYPGEPADRPYANTAALLTVARRGAPPAWLAKLNAYRRSAGLASVDEDPVLSAEARRHTAWLARAHVLSHPETPGTRGFSYIGDEAGRSSDIDAGAVGAAAVTGWWDTPYHRTLMADRGVHTVGYAQTGMFAALMADWWVQWSAAPLRAPLTWPARNATIDDLAFSGNEYPDPLAACHWPARTRAGVPISVIGAPSGPAAAALYDRGRRLAVCVVPGAPGVILPKARLAAGHRYTVLWRSGKTTLRWDFRTAAKAR